MLTEILKGLTMMILIIINCSNSEASASVFDKSQEVMFCCLANGSKYLAFISAQMICFFERMKLMITDM